MVSAVTWVGEMGFIFYDLLFSRKYAIVNWEIKIRQICLVMNVLIYNMSRRMRFPTMWFVGPAKPQISLHIHAVSSEPLLVA